MPLISTAWLASLLALFLLDAENHSEYSGEHLRTLDDNYLHSYVTSFAIYLIIFRKEISVTVFLK